MPRTRAPVREMTNSWTDTRKPWASSFQLAAMTLRSSDTGRCPPLLPPVEARDAGPPLDDGHEADDRQADHQVDDHGRGQRLDALEGEGADAVGRARRLQDADGEGQR